MRVNKKKGGGRFRAGATVMGGGGGSARQGERPASCANGSAEGAGQ
jgi:hypothetical protein